MSKEELIDAYASGRISRRSFAKGMAAFGGALAAAIVLERSAGAQASDPGKSPVKKGVKKAGKKPITTTTTTTLLQ